MTANALPPVETVKEFLEYNPETGIFTWKARSISYFKTDRSCSIWNTRFVGKSAGYKNDQGYVLIAIEGRHYRAHRLAWLYMTGNEPEEEIDHIDHDPSNNKFSNLRESTRAQNMANTRIYRVGLEGIRKRGDKYRACISDGNKPRLIGTYRTLDDARVAYAQAAVSLRGEFVPDEIRALADNPVPEKCTSKGQVRGTGVTKHGDKFRAHPYINGARVHLGIFNTFAEASQAVDCARNGRS